MSSYERTRPPLSAFDLSEINPPKDGILYLYRCNSSGAWYVEPNEDMAIQEATGYPVGELVEYQEMGDYESGEWGEIIAVYVSDGKWRDNRNRIPRTENEVR